MTKTRAPLALELLFLIIDFAMEDELQQYQHVFAPFTASTMYQIILSCHTFHDYVIKQEKYQQLRLWRLLNRIPKQFEPVQVALGEKEHFTIVSIDMSAEKIIPMMIQQHPIHQHNTMETFLVLQETTSSIRSYYTHNDYLVKTKLSVSDRWNKRLKNKMNQHKKKKNTISTGNDDIRHELLMEKRKKKKCRENKFSLTKSNHGNDHSIKNDIKNNMDYIENEDNNDEEEEEDDDDTIAIPLFPLSIFIQYIKWYAQYHDASIWLWKRSARYFKGEEVNLLFQHEFRYILDTTRHALIAWDRPSNNNFRFTDHVLNSNVELFSKLLPTT
ncbi:unnamed protein product [Cunninghamella blakesleeana]